MVHRRSLPRQRLCLPSMELLLWPPYHIRQKAGAQAVGTTSNKLLLSVIELGGYPNFGAVYEGLGYEVVQVNSSRKALAALKKHPPAAIVAEFNYQHEFRDRTSSLESILACVQSLPGIKVVVFYPPEQAAQLEKLRARFPIFQGLAYPVRPDALEALLRDD